LCGAGSQTGAQRGGADRVCLVHHGVTPRLEAGEAIAKVKPIIKARSPGSSLPASKYSAGCGPVAQTVTATDLARAEDGDETRGENQQERIVGQDHSAVR